MKRGSHLSYPLSLRERLKKVVKRKERQGSYSLFFMEPGGHYWEIESYENRAKSRDVAFPWTQPLVSDEFSARGYTPQAFTHSTSRER